MVESACQRKRCKRCGFDPWVGKIPWRKKWQNTPVFLPGEFHGQRSLVGYSLFKELDTTEHAFPNKIKSNLFFSFVFGLVPLAHRMLSEASYLVLQTRVPCGKWPHEHWHLPQTLNSRWRLWAVCRDAAPGTVTWRVSGPAVPTPPRTPPPQPSKAAPPTTCLGSVCSRA